MSTILGLMSGTSLDGLDLAVCSFEKTESGLKYTIEQADTLPYSDYWINRLAEAPDLGAKAIYELDYEYGVYLGQRIKEFLSGKRTTLIASHGHTVFHDPSKGISLQIGSPSAIAAQTGFDVLSGFRSMDVALGGQGAPLAPIGDELLFGEYYACLNLGGIANVSFEEKSIRRGVDCCGCNIVLNLLAERLGLPYDSEGSNASRGDTDKQLIDQLLQNPFFSLPSPKSLDKAEVLDIYKPVLCSKKPVQDLLATMVEHIAAEIARQLPGDAAGRMLLSGGGAHNAFLRERIQAYSPLEVEVPSKLLVDYKEALIFALMGYLYLQGQINIPSSTGSTPHIGGLMVKGSSIS